MKLTKAYEITTGEGVVALIMAKSMTHAYELAKKITGLEEHQVICSETEVDMETTEFGFYANPR